MINKPEFMQIFKTRICACWPTTSGEAISEYWRQLEPFTAKAIGLAIDAAARADEDRREPRPASPQYLARLCRQVQEDGMTKEQTIQLAEHYTVPEGSVLKRTLEGQRAREYHDRGEKCSYAWCEKCGSGDVIEDAL